MRQDKNGHNIFDYRVVLSFVDTIGMAGQGLETIKYTHDEQGAFFGEEVTLEDFITALQEDLSSITSHAYDVSFYFNYDKSIAIDYNTDVVPDKDIDLINDYLFYSNFHIKVRYTGEPI